MTLLSYEDPPLLSPILAGHAGTELTDGIFTLPLSQGDVMPQLWPRKGPLQCWWDIVAEPPWWEPQHHPKP